MMNSVMMMKGMDAGKAEALAGAITHTIELAKENVRRHCEVSRVHNCEMAEILKLGKYQIVFPFCAGESFRFCCKRGIG